MSATVARLEAGATSTDTFKSPFAGAAQTSPCANSAYPPPGGLSTSGGEGGGSRRGYHQRCDEGVPLRRPVVGCHLRPTRGTNLQRTWIYLPLDAAGPATETVHPLDPGVRAPGGRQLGAEEEILGKALVQSLQDGHRALLGGVATAIRFHLMHRDGHNDHLSGRERAQLPLQVSPPQRRVWWQRHHEDTRWSLICQV